jgi:hypothetical protein
MFIYVYMNITVLNMGRLLVSGIWQLARYLATDMMKWPATVILSLLYLEEERTKSFETLVMSVNVRTIRTKQTEGLLS